MHGLRGVFRGCIGAFEGNLGVFRRCSGAIWRQLPPQRSFRGVRRGQSGHLEAFPVLVPPFKGPFEVLPRPRTPLQAPADHKKVLDLALEDPFSASQGAICIPLRGLWPLHHHEFVLVDRERTVFSGQIVLKHRRKPLEQGCVTPHLPMWSMLNGAVTTPHRRLDRRVCRGAAEACIYGVRSISSRPSLQSSALCPWRCSLTCDASSAW